MCCGEALNDPVRIRERHIRCECHERSVSRVARPRDYHRVRPHFDFDDDDDDEYQLVIARCPPSPPVSDEISYTTIKRTHRSTSVIPIKRIRVEGQRRLGQCLEVIEPGMRRPYGHLGGRRPILEIQEAGRHHHHYHHHRRQHQWF
ncbi:hypothetical protein FQN54_007902 [Arachnomyces sp. PD_36]|nr:hypothetical protein FQN54_007902 [Arachnomyces sp. PD_36]